MAMKCLSFEHFIYKVSKSQFAFQRVEEVRIIHIFLFLRKKIINIFDYHLTYIPIYLQKSLTHTNCTHKILNIYLFKTLKQNVFLIFQS
jgi:hypothetical protein